VSAPTAAADATDNQFLNSLREVNDPTILTLIDAAPGLVTTTGRKVCTMLDQQYGGLAVKGMVQDDLHLQNELRGYYSGLFAVYAVAAYCPNHQADSGFNDQY
jgi:hypothetical protein